MAQYQEKQLFQVVGTGSPATAYTKPADPTTSIVRTIFIMNPTAGALTWSLYNDDNGASYISGTGLFISISIAANTTVELNSFIAMDTASGTIGVTGNGLTFTGYGVEIG